MVLEVKDKLAELVSPANLVEAAVNWGLIEESFFDIDVVDLYNLACACATVKVETGIFQPVQEVGSQNYFIQNYWVDVGTRNALGNITQADAYNYKGRGFIQLTGRSNYERAAIALKLPQLLGEPDLACNPQIAAKVFVWYWQGRGLVATCKQLATVAPQYHASILVGIRQKVNGGLTGYAEFLAALKLLQLT